MSSRPRSADPDSGVGNELVGRQRQIQGRRAAPDATRRVVDRAMAGAEVAVVGPLMRDRDAAEMGAYADQHLEVGVVLLDARRVRLRVGQARQIDVLRLFDLLVGTVIDEDRLAAPEHLDDLACGNRRQIDLDRCTGRDGRSVRIHLRDQRHQRRGRADRTHGAGRDVKKVAARGFGRRNRCHALIPLPDARAAGPRRGPSESTLPEGGGRSGRIDPRARRVGTNRRGLLAPLYGERKCSMATLRQPRTSASLPGSFRPSEALRIRYFEVMRIALYEPDIPQNAGTILRLAACLDTEAHILEPRGFALTYRAVRRSGMDYLGQVRIARHGSWDEFDQWRRGDGGRLILFTTRGSVSYLDH